MSLLNFFPIFPLYYGGKTKFAPIHASDLTDIIFHVIENDIRGKKIETVGPKVLTFLEILNTLSKCINKKRVFLPLPLFLAKFSAKILIQILEKNALLDLALQQKVFCLSESIQSVMYQNGFKNLYSAISPNEASLLNVVKKAH